MKSKQLLSVSGGAVALVVVLGIAIAVNVILGALNLRMDLTEEKLYALSDGTKQIAKDLDGTVTLKFFFSESAVEVPIELKNFARRVEDLLKEYEIAADGNIVIEKYDPEPDSDAEDWAQRYGLSGQSMGFVGPTLYLGLVATMGDAEAVLPVLDPRAENMLEYNVTRMITRVANPEKPVVGILSSLPVMGGERPPYPMPGQPPPEPAWFAVQDLQKDYEVRKVDPAAEEISDEIDTLLVVHPKDFTDSTLYAIDQFVLRGGRLCVFVDPLCITDAQANRMPQPGMRMQSYASNMERLFKAWGVEFSSSKVVADLEAPSRLRGPDNTIEQSPVWLSLRGQNMNKDEILTSNIESVMMPYAGYFTVTPKEDVEVTSLISTSESSGPVDAMMAQFGGQGLMRNFHSGMKRLDLALRLHGKLKTAFPDGKPKDESAKNGEKEDDSEADVSQSLAESTDASTVILFGDADMLYDQFCVRKVNVLFGFEAHQPLNENLTVLNNAVEQLAGSSALIGIRSRGKTLRPFEVVLEIERDAQERYLSEEKRLQDKLTDLQTRLRELQQRDKDSQQFILNAAQKEEVAKFEDQVYETRQALKLVRRQLRKDVERLGMRVKVINILLMPLCVAVAGLSFYGYRRRKTRRRG